VPTSPRSIRIEASSHCQLRCPSCPTTTGAARPTIGAGFLRAEDFARVLDLSPEVTDVELSNYGEIFLNPELEAILACAHERGVVAHAGNGVNLNFAREGILDALVRYGVGNLTCSIDGASPETYARYRVRGDFERVMSNVRALVDAKRARASPFPRMRWQFVVFGHNEHEIERARAMATELGMDFFPKLTWDDDFSPIRDTELVRRSTGSKHVTRAEHRAATGRDYQRGICPQLWRAPAYNWDGKMLGCCRNFWGDFGANVFDDGVAATMGAERLGYAKQMLRGTAAPRDDVPCTTCELYETMRSDGSWLTDAEVDTSRAPEIHLGVRIDAPGVAAKEARVVVAGTSGRGSARVRLRDGEGQAYFAVPPGPYVVSVQAGERETTDALDVAARPTLRALHVKLDA